MLQLLDRYDHSPEARQHLLDGLDQHLRAVIASKGQGLQGQVALAEADVRADPGLCIRFDREAPQAPRSIDREAPQAPRSIDRTGSATVHAGGRVYQGGRFSIPQLGELLAQARTARAAAGPTAARCVLWVFDGASPATDIGALQATAPPRSLFQVASQFNCLESPGSFVTPVADYLHDPTQGPRASISAFPGTLVRHYAAPAADGSRFVQSTDGPQINLLQDVCGQAAAVRSGYLRSTDISDPGAFATALTERFEHIRIGLHDGVEVVLGHDWAGAVTGQRTIAQVFTSTVAAGMYGGLDQVHLGICRQLQRAAYLGTLLGAAALGHERVVLTLIGGGVFGNPLQLIWEAILWALDEVQGALQRDLVVVVNGRNLSQEVAPGDLRRAARNRGGGMIHFYREARSAAVNDRGGATVRDE